VVCFPKRVYRQLDDDFMGEQDKTLGTTYDLGIGTGLVGPAHGTDADFAGEGDYVPDALPICCACKDDCLLAVAILNSNGITDDNFLVSYNDVPIGETIETDLTGNPDQLRGTVYL